MWSLTITNPRSEPLQIKLTPGKLVIGRMATSDIVINDVAASRRHAEIFFDSISELVAINDLKSSNGTYVNHQRITGFYRLQNGDVIRIGQTEMHLTKITNTVTDQKDISGTRLFTRELVLEAIDENPIPLNEITEKLNTVVDIDSAISLVIDLIKRTIGVDVCEIILAQNFNKINMENENNLMVRAIRNSSVEISPLALCVPVTSGEKPFALIYLEKIRPGAHPFDEREMQLVVGISHQTALTMQRIELLEKVRKEGQVKQLLLRFVSPIEAEGVLKDYLKTGNLPDLAEKKVTVLFVEIADSTGQAKRIGPKKFSLFLNSFYQYASQVVFKNGGMVKYLGDGVLAVFVETKENLNHEERAAIVAQEIIEFVKKADPSELDRACVVGVAINTGKAMVGYVGTQERAEFNVMGNLIKVTYRMQEYALPNRIFVGASTAEAIRNKYLVQKAGSLVMRGSEQPIQVYEVSFVKTVPFVQTEKEKEKDSDMSAAFKGIAEKLKALEK
jgi:class 3 adenylate cyclase/pSer/pThr/pTyr-binding forkhead associated (FHA) protein